MRRSASTSSRGKGGDDSPPRLTAQASGSIMSVQEHFALSAVDKWQRFRLYVRT